MKDCVKRLFQFQYGAIRGAADLKFASLRDYFNSSMVRLEVVRCILSTNLVFYFNSSMVRLEELGGALMAFDHEHFNSSMVRLEVSITASFQP